MAVLKDSDFFDFEKYRNELADTASAALAFAQSTESSATRIRTAYDGTINQLTQIQTQLAGVSVSQTETAGQKLREYEKQIDKLADEADRYKTLLKQLNDTQTASGLSIADMTRLLSGLEREYKSLKPDQTDFTTRQADIATKVRAVSTVLNAQNQVFREAKRATDAAEGSYNKLSQETTELRSALRQMPGAFDATTGAINRNNHAAVEMQHIIERNDRALRTMDASMGQHQRHVGNYGSVLTGLGSQALMAAGSIIGVSSALDAITSALGVISSMERIDASLKAVSKDTADFRNTQEFLIATADRLGLQYETLARSYKGLKAATNNTALEGKATQQVFTGLVNAGAALKLSNEEVQGAIFAVTQMMSKGRVSAEELRQQLAERLPGAVRLLAEAMGVSEPKLNKMLEQGELLAVNVLPKLASQLDKTYGKDAQNNIQSMAGGWNRMTNQVHLFLAALNDNQAVSNTANTFTSMIAEVLKGMRVAVQSNDWKTFFGYFAKFTPGLMMSGIAGRATQQITNNARNQTVVDEFKTMTPQQREARIDITKDNIDRNESRLKKEFGNSIIGGNKSKVENALAADRDLLIKLRRADLKLRLKDKADADQAEINAVRAADSKKEQDKERLEKEAKKREAARKKAQSEADRKVNDALGLAKSGTDVSLADLNNRKQDGLVSERDFIDERQKITLAGIAERERILERAGKKETDDYRRIKKEKLDAETLFKRDSLKLALSDSKSTTTTALAELSGKKADGTVSDADYVEQKLKITVGGLRDQQRIVEEAGQQESQLYRDLDKQILDSTKDYYRERLKVTQDAWKKELDETKIALKNVDNALGEEYADQLLILDKFYSDKERKVQVDRASNKITPEAAEGQLHELKMYRLQAELQLTEKTYAKDRTLSNVLIDDKIAALNRYKADALTTPKEIAEAEAQIGKLKQLKEQEAADDKKKLDKDVADNAKKNSDESTAHEIANAEKAVQKRQQLWQAGLQLADTIGSSIFSVSDAYRQQENERLDQQHDREIALAGDNADAKARIEEQYQARKRELARKAAIQEREAALFSIAINTAQAVMSVLATGGGAHYLDFGVSAGILSAFVTAAGIAQAAAVLAKPLPAFWTGTTNAPEGLALVGDRGPELRQSAKDKSYTYYERPTVDYLNAGDTVYTASQTRRIVEDWQKQEATRWALQESLLYGSTADTLRAGRFDEQVIIHQLAGGSRPSLSKTDVRDAFGEALDNRPADVTTFDEHGVRRGMKTATGYTEYMEKRTRW